MKLLVNDMDYTKMNAAIRADKDKEVILDNVIGQRFIGCGLSNKNIIINGTSGNALAAHMDGANITVYGNAQDATGDTMNAGNVIIHGNCGDTTGYGMRGGKIFIKGYAGYRVGIHMKEYMDQKPVIVIGGKCGDFLGEYQAGGNIIVLGIGCEDISPVGKYCGTGIHGGAIYIRSRHLPPDLHKQVLVSKPTKEDMNEIGGDILKFCELFNEDYNKIISSDFIKLSANSRNQYKQLYTIN